MHKIITLLLIYTSIFAIEPDKQKHFGYSALIATSIDQVLYHTTNMSYPERIGATMATTIAIGFAKELSDDNIDHKDLLFDVSGAIIGSILSESINVHVMPLHGGAMASIKIKF